jgi:TPR repeat protein
MDFEDASSQGLAAGQFNLGYCLLNGLRIDRDVIRDAELMREESSRDGSGGFCRVS